MNAMDFLSRPYRIYVLLEKARQKVAALQSLTERVTARFGLESVPVSHSRNTSAMQDTIAVLMEAKEETARLEDELAKVELETGMVLARLPDETLHDFMVARFLDYLPIAAITEKMNYSYSWGRLELAKGVSAVQQILDEMEADGESPFIAAELAGDWQDIAD
ncbi:MAG: hypothetical protein K6A68_11190 [Clostridiales bacterium]|nr:hypothetical protein [Clostridiales bacterium]